MSAEIKPGSVVTLASGSPPMTVEKSTPNGCECAWFDGTHLFRGTFQKDSLIARLEEKASEAAPAAKPVEKHTEPAKPVEKAPAKP
jgi:uncharacterized protein YodC (DUF2158 family)